MAGVNATSVAVVGVPRVIRMVAVFDPRPSSGHARYMRPNQSTASATEGSPDIPTGATRRLGPTPTDPQSVAVAAARYTSYACGDVNRWLRPSIHAMTARPPPSTATVGANCGAVPVSSLTRIGSPNVSPRSQLTARYTSSSPRLLSFHTKYTVDPCTATLRCPPEN